MYTRRRCSRGGNRSGFGQRRPSVSLIVPESRPGTKAFLIRKLVRATILRKDKFRRARTLKPLVKRCRCLSKDSPMLALSTQGVPHPRDVFVSRVGPRDLPSRNHHF